MPKIERVELLDDLEYAGGAPDGREVEAQQTRELTVGTQRYRTYLSDENAKRFDEDMAVWTQFAEPISVEPAPRAATRAAGSGTGKRTAADRELSGKQRRWAKGQGMNVSERGRISDEVQEAYFRAHPEDRPAA